MLPQLTEIIHSDNSSFNYLYCLRILLSHNIISVLEITKFHVIEFIVRCIAKHVNESHLLYALDSIRMMLINNMHLGRNCLKLGLLPYLLKVLINVM
jgi:hypothetical protein